MKFNKIMLISLTFSWLAFPNLTFSSDEKGEGLVDAFTLHLSSDMENYISLYEISKGNSKALEKLKIYMVDRENDLGNYFPHSKKLSTVQVVCESQAKNLNKLKMISEDCKDGVGQELCSSVYVMNKLCIAKGYIDATNKN